MNEKVIDIFAIGGLAALLLAFVAVVPSEASPNFETPSGAYLAGRHAQETRDYAAAASWFEDALTTDPDSPELISRTFLMEASEGRFDRARPLAVKELTLDSTDAVAELVLLIDRIKADDKAGALARAEALPAEGVHRFLGPLALAWTRMAVGDLAGADAALRQLDKFNGFAPLEYYQLGLLYDFAGEPDKAEENFKKTLEATGQLNWRLTDAMANFYERHGRADEAGALYQRFIKDNAGSELAESVLARKPAAQPLPLIDSAKEGLAEALFDLASVVNQPETIDLALLYARCALQLRPHLALAQLLLSDVLSAQNKPEESLAILAEIPPNSPYSWSARLRFAADLEMLDRTEEAIAQLKEMSAEAPTRAGAEMQLGDLLRGKKRFNEAVKAYDEAIRRLQAAGMPERWSLYYSRGIALERSGEWKLSEVDLLHALELKPDQPLVLNYLGYSWIDKGENLQRGLKMIEKAVELRPEDGYIVDSLGWAHYRLGDYSSAVEYLEKAIELVPEDPTINDHLGDAYWQSGRPSEARFQWRRALQFGPEADEIKPIEAKLDRGLVSPLEPAAAEPAMAVTAFAPAKVNLYLHIIGRRTDGYHLLDSLIAFADIGDRITAEPATTLSLEISGPEASGLADLGQDNLVLRAARLLADHAGMTQGAALHLEKNLPIAAGIGGGSSDAAAALRVLAALWHLSIGEEALLSLGAQLGADLAVCLYGRAARLGGIGEWIEPAPELPEAGILLVNPRKELPTASVYAARRGPYGDAGRFTAMPGDAIGLARTLVLCRNDLTGAAIGLVPEIGAVLASLARLPGALIARMSGSGATCFALFSDRSTAEAARISLAAAEPGWWCAAGGLSG